MLILVIIIKSPKLDLSLTHSRMKMTPILSLSFFYQCSSALHQWHNCLTGNMTKNLPVLSCTLDLQDLILNPYALRWIWWPFASIAASTVLGRLATRLSVCGTFCPADPAEHLWGQMLMLKLESLTCCCSPRVQWILYTALSDASLISPTTGEPQSSWCTLFVLMLMPEDLWNSAVT